MNRAMLVGIILLCVVSFSGMAEAQEDYWFFDGDGDPVFYFTLPEDWYGDWQEDDEGFSVFVAYPEDEGLTMALWVPHNIDLLDLAEQQIISSRNEAVADIIEGEWETESNDYGISCTYSDSAGTEIETDDPMEIRMAFCNINPAYSIIINAYGIGEGWHDNLEELDDIFDSLRFDIEE